jgi:hypothetical protein
MKPPVTASTTTRGIILPATLVAGLIAAPMLALGQSGPAPTGTTAPPAASPSATPAPGSPGTATFPARPTPQAATPGTPAPAAPGTAAAPARPGTSTAATPGAVTGTPTNRASRIIGANVLNERNETVGEIEDLIINASGAPTAILSVGGFLGIGARLVAVPFSELSFNNERERWVLNGATRETLQARPPYSYQSRS